MSKPVDPEGKPAPRESHEVLSRTTAGTLRDDLARLGLEADTLSALVRANRTREQVAADLIRYLALA